MHLIITLILVWFLFVCMFMSAFAGNLGNSRASKVWAIFGVAFGLLIIIYVYLD